MFFIIEGRMRPQVVHRCTRSAMSNQRAEVAQSKVSCGPVKGFRCSKSILSIDNLSFLIILNLTFLMQVDLSATLSRLHHCILDSKAFITLV